MSLVSCRIADESYSKGVPDRSSFSSLLYGLIFRSQWPLPYAECAEAGSPAIELVEGSPRLFEEAARKAAHLPVDKDWLHYTRLADGSSYLRWPGLYDFLISADGRRIFGRPAREDISLESFHSYLLSLAFSFSLLKLGFDPLHATVLAVDGSAFGFLGKGGYGKSTLAGAFLQAGYPMVTDDLLVLQKDSEGFSAYPGPPRIKLNPRIARVLIGERAAGIPMNPVTCKLIIPLNHAQCPQTAVPLKTLYALNSPSPGVRNGRITIRRLSQRRALLALLKHSFNDWVNEPARLNHQLQLYSQIASQVTIKLISYLRRLSSLSFVRDAILKDLNHE